MSLTVSFNPVSMTVEQYDEVIRRLEQAGAGKPAGRLHYVCFGFGGHMRVVDIWQSEETFAAFGGLLLPILEAVGVDIGQPEVAPVHSVIVG
ncbi:MAG: hypothetical protein K1X87_01145 [Dehalococcoidia bacterium]|nr:hypothetical protein [Dehalococcoidia bacterium]